MGGTNSTTRSLTIEEDAANSVMITEGVAHRLTSGNDNSKVATSEGELRRMQQFYERKIKMLEDQNAELYATSIQKFAATVQEVENKFLTTSAAPVCASLQQAVIMCYNSNPKQTLNCAAQVHAFNNCVQNYGEQNLSKRHG